MRIGSLGWSDDVEVFPALCAKIRTRRDSAMAPRAADRAAHGAPIASYIVPDACLEWTSGRVLLAAGRADLLLRVPTSASFHDAVWDHAAGALVVSEAGGRVSDLAGRSLDFSTGRRLLRNSGLLASNGWLHDAALRAIEVSRAGSALTNIG